MEVYVDDILVKSKNGGRLHRTFETDVQHSIEVPDEA